MILQPPCNCFKQPQNKAAQLPGTIWACVMSRVAAAAVLISLQLRRVISRRPHQRPYCGWATCVCSSMPTQVPATPSGQLRTLAVQLAKLQPVQQQLWKELGVAACGGGLLETNTVSNSRSKLAERAAAEATLELYQKAAEAGAAEAQHIVGRVCWNQGRADAAVECWHAAGAQGYGPALLCLGGAAEKGWQGVHKNHAAAMPWQQRVAAGKGQSSWQCWIKRLLCSVGQPAVV